MTAFQSFMDKGLAYPPSSGEQDPQSLFDQFLNHDSADFLIDCTRPEPSLEVDFNFDFDEDTTTYTSEGHSASSTNTFDSTLESLHSQNHPQPIIERAAALRPHRSLPRSQPATFDPSVSANDLLSLEGKVIRPPSPAKAGYKSLRRKPKHSSTTELEKSTNRISKAKSNDKMQSSYHHRQERPSFPDWTQRFQQISLQQGQEQIHGQAVAATDMTSQSAAGASEDPHANMATPLQTYSASVNGTPASKLRHPKSFHNGQSPHLSNFHQFPSPSRLNMSQVQAHFQSRQPEDSASFAPQSPWTSAPSQYHSQEFHPASAAQGWSSAAEENQSSFFTNANDHSYDEQMVDYPEVGPQYSLTFPHYNFQQASMQGYKAIAGEREEALSPHSLPPSHHSQAEGYMTFGFPPPRTPTSALHPRTTTTSTPPTTPLSPTNPTPAPSREGKEVHTPTSRRRNGNKPTTLRLPKSTPHLSTVSKTPSKSSLRSPRSAGALKRTHGFRNLHSASSPPNGSAIAVDSGNGNGSGSGSTNHSSTSTTPTRANGYGHHRSSKSGSYNHPPSLSLHTTKTNITSTTSTSAPLTAPTPMSATPTPSLNTPAIPSGHTSISRSGTLSASTSQDFDFGFVNFTPSDSTRILTGVAPSGSSKTKARREQEALERKRRLSQAAERAVREAGGDVGGLREVFEL